MIRLHNTFFKEDLCGGTRVLSFHNLTSFFSKMIPFSMVINVQYLPCHILGNYYWSKLFKGYKKKSNHLPLGTQNICSTEYSTVSIRRMREVHFQFSLENGHFAAPTFNCASNFFTLPSALVFYNVLVVKVCSHRQFVSIL